MKKIFLMIAIFIFLTGCTNKKITNIDYNTTVDCNNKPKLLLSKQDINIYAYCIESIIVNNDNEKTNLKEYIEKNDNAIDNIINKLEHTDSLEDGGTKIYKGTNITIIKCNTLDGNKDIYIGNENMQFKQNFCKNNNYTFIRTYTVKNIEKYTEQQYEDGIEVSYGNSFKVELSTFQGETKEVIINNLWYDLEKDKTYEFEFMSNGNTEDNIESIFKNSKIIEIRETNKTGLNQLQEKIKE